MSRNLRIAGAQLGPIQRGADRAETLARLIALLEAAAAEGAELVVFPELALTTFFPRWWMDAADPELAARGREQAARVVRALQGDDVDAVYSSPAARALQTAAPLAAALGLAVDVEPGLAEFDAAHASYVPIEELKAAGDPRWHALKLGDLEGTGVDPAAFAAATSASSCSSVPSTSPLMNSSTKRRASPSSCCTAGDFMK